MKKPWTYKLTWEQRDGARGIDMALVGDYESVRYAWLKLCRPFTVDDVRRVVVNYSKRESFFQRFYPEDSWPRQPMI